MNVVKSKKLPLYLALDLTQGERYLDGDEILSVFKVPLSQAIEMVLNNSINSELSALAILLAVFIYSITQNKVSQIEKLFFLQKIIQLQHFYLIDPFQLIDHFVVRVY